MEKDIGGDGWGVWCCSEALTSILHPRPQHAMWETGMERQVQGTRCEAKLSCSPSISSFLQVPLQSDWSGDSGRGVVGTPFMHQPGRARLTQALVMDGVDGVHVQAGNGSGGGRGSYNTIDISAMLFPPRPHCTPDATRGWGPSSSDAPLGPAVVDNDTLLDNGAHTPEFPWTVGCGR
jgi:hypothetical protein